MCPECLTFPLQNILIIQFIMRSYVTDGRNVAPETLRRVFRYSIGRQHQKHIEMYSSEIQYTFQYFAHYSMLSRPLYPVPFRQQ